MRETSPFKNTIFFGGNQDENYEGRAEDDSLNLFYTFHSLFGTGQDTMSDTPWGGTRRGAGRPTLKEEEKARPRAIKFYDHEWELIKKKAEESGQGLREYIMGLVNKG
ncbi:hypothetical protein K7I13_12190 [Brucepastera parasyntrophica]|uniref:hypothetical protein n=1 Tax=Brucepastera parasyntrophica TaxID=2880008 RepID=UPI00210CACF4|nr:hypothetical protein [Brucepastera parasyntrophica]ULQ59245.1 hypothetical protein K7I13_12190 [Brucepastera parasyntrophica]